ncbi:Phox homologous domain-containing protein [Triangularia verruculosa]|uniref:Endosomal/vacuolar adapter protein YPT35 n=1 Tax=Triangularia verruculosa TaxID=2587418 RepID=A0AAN6XNP0_9PEZI|nr:Phox homologous domain-containing protein [Triangularia verruculosa]
MASEIEHEHPQAQPAQAPLLNSNKRESSANMSSATDSQAVPESTPRRTPLFDDGEEDDDDDDDDDDVASTTSSSNHDNGHVTSPSVTSPPYWHSSNHPPNRTNSSNLRPLSTASIESVLPPGAITLQDNESELPSNHYQTSPSTPQDRNRACWARSVTITDYITINTSSTNLGAFTVWNISVETLEGPRINIRKRYSEFDDLRKKLIMTFPGFEAAVPELPPKSIMKRFQPKFLEKRRGGLQYFLNCILLNPEFSGAPVVREFLFT